MKIEKRKTSPFKKQEKVVEEMAKKLLSLILAVCCISTLLWGCGVQRKEPPKPAETKTGLNSVSELETLQRDPVEKTKAPVIRECNGKRAEGGMEIPGTHFALEEGTALAPLPVYVDPCPYWQAGQLYEVSEEDRAGMKEQIRDYLRLFYGEETQIREENFIYRESNNDNAPPKDYRLYLKSGHDSVGYDDGTIRLGSSMEGFSVMMPREEAAETALRENDETAMLEIPAVKVVLEMMEIDDPLVRNVSNLTTGEINSYDYLITQRSEELSENIYEEAFHSVNISMDTDEEVSYIYISTKDVSPSQVVPLESVSYAQARDYVLEKYPEQFANGFSCEVYYEDWVEIGFYIPCYRFMSPEGFNIQVAMADYSPIEGLFIPGEEFIWPREESQPVSSEPETVTSLPPEEN